MATHLRKTVGPFRNPLSHGNAVQLARLVGGPDFVAPSRLVDMDSGEEANVELTLQDRVILAPLLAEFAERSAPAAVRLVAELHVEASGNLKTITRPAKFPEQFMDRMRKKKRGHK